MQHMILLHLSNTVSGMEEIGYQLHKVRQLSLDILNGACLADCNKLIYKRLVQYL